MIFGIQYTSIVECVRAFRVHASYSRMSRLRECVLAGGGVEIFVDFVIFYFVHCVRVYTKSKSAMHLFVPSKC